MNRLASAHCTIIRISSLFLLGWTDIYCWIMDNVQPTVSRKNVWLLTNFVYLACKNPPPVCNNILVYKFNKSEFDNVDSLNWGQTAVKTDAFQGRADACEEVPLQ